MKHNCSAPGQGNTCSSTVANGGSWALDQNLAYTIFIDIHKKSMTSKKKMREMHFYGKLSAFVATRTSSQCRSHHQKLFTKFKYLSKIRQVFRAEIGISNYKTQLKEGILKMEIIEQSWNSLNIKEQDEGTPENHLPDQLPEVQRSPEVQKQEFVPFQPVYYDYGYGRLGVMNGLSWLGFNYGLGSAMGSPFLQ